MSLTTVNPAQVLKHIQGLQSEDQLEILKLLDKLQKSKDREAAQSDFLTFVKIVWPAFIEGEHHKIMSDAFNRIASGELKRLIINMPPRHWALSR